MCRLVLMNKNGEKEIEKNYGLTEFLSYLERSFGGHGNGVSLLKDGKVICLQKGVNLSVKEISNIIKKKNYDWCIFHTRLASVGSKSDKNCHPFMIGTEVMAMNGTERTEKLLTKVKDITDTEAILKVKEKFGLEVPALKNLSSIFVGFSKGKPYVVANNTHNIKLLYKKSNTSIVFASEFPDKFKQNIYAPKEEFVWNSGPIGMANFKKYVKEIPTRFYSSYFDTRGYGQTSFVDYDNEELSEDVYYQEYLQELEEYERQELEKDEKEQQMYEKMLEEGMMKDAA